MADLHLKSNLYLPTTEYTELQPLLSGVHSVMRVKSVLAGEGGGAPPPPLITFTLTSKVAVYAPAEWADTLTLFHLYQYMYSVLPTLRSMIDLESPTQSVYTVHAYMSEPAFGTIFRITGG